MWYNGCIVEMVTEIEIRIASGRAGRLAAQRASWKSSNYALSNPGHEDAHDLMHELDNHPVAGEKSCPALIPVDECQTIHMEEAVYESRRMIMADQKFNVVNVPNNPSEDEIKRAEGEWKKADEGFEKDRFLTTVSRNGFRLLGVKAREGQRDKDGNFVTKKNAAGEVVKVYRNVFTYIWIPSYSTGTIDQFVAWFAKRLFGEVTEATMASAFTVFKKKAIDAEMITLRTKMKAKKTGQGRGGDLSF